VIAYAKRDPTIFDHPQSNPRALKYASDVLQAAAENKAEPKTVQVVLAGLIGRARAAALWTLVQGADSALAADDVLQSYLRHRSCVAEWIKLGRLDLLESTLLQLKKHLQVQSNYERVRRKLKQWKNWGTFLSDLPGDLQAKAQNFCAEHEYAWPLQKSRGKTVMIISRAMQKLAGPRQDWHRHQPSGKRVPIPRAILDDLIWLRARSQQWRYCPGRHV
jgi:hypothetical protein